MDAFIGEIRAFGFNYVPAGWLQCSNTPFSATQYPALYAVIGNLYGGNQQTFNVPDLRGMIINGQGQFPGGSNYQVGSIGGTNQVTLIPATIPSHNHTMNGAVTSTTPIVQEVTTPTGGSYLSNIGSQTANKIGFAYGHNTNPPNPPNVPLGIQTIGFTGGNMSHDNMAPYLPLIYCICYDGAFPTPP